MTYKEVGPESRDIDTPGVHPIDDELKIRRFLVWASDLEAPLEFKLKGLKQKFNSRFLGEIQKGSGTFHIEALTEDEANQFRDSLQMSGVNECVMTLNMNGQVMVGLETKFLGQDKSGLLFAKPTRVFQIQKRNSVRYAIPGGYEMFVEMDSVFWKGVKVQKKLLDVSRGGISFRVATEQEASMYKKGDVLSEVVFRIRTQVIRVNVRVCGISKIPPHIPVKGLRVGVAFEKISKEDQEYIDFFIKAHAGPRMV